MWRSVLEWLATPPWLERILTKLIDPSGAAGHTFYVFDYGWQPEDIAGLLRGGGVQLRAMTRSHGLLAVVVTAGDAAWAQYVLDGAGLPIYAGRLPVPRRRSRGVQVIDLRRGGRPRISMPRSRRP